MSASGTVLFNASEGYDADMWDDSALIKEYDRALESSRELIRCRKAKTSGKKGRDWKIGDVCRAVYSEDGLEYEGSVVFCNKANRSVTVRFFGYNNEEDIKEKDLLESLGNDEIEAQIEQARLDLEEEEEEEGAGDEYRLGDWCRARWTEDERVYEATVESVDRRKGTAKVKFVGFGNSEVKQLEDLYMSKGEEKRAEQEEFSNKIKDAVNVEVEDLQNLLIKNCPDLLANFGESSDLGFGNLSIGEEPTEKKKKKKETKEKKEKTKGKEKKEKVKEVSVKSEPESVSSGAGSGQYSTQNNSFPSFPPAAQFPGLGSPASPFLPPGLPTGLGMPMHPGIPNGMPMHPGIPNGMPMHPGIPNGMPIPPGIPNGMPMPPGIPNGMPIPPGIPNGMPIPPGIPNGMPMPPGLSPVLPPNLPPPPSLPVEVERSVGPELHSLLLSWYMAGYHTGLYQGASQARLKKSKKK